MDSPIIVYSINANEIEIDEYEVLRYLGYQRTAVTQNDIRLVQRSIPSVLNVISGRACYGRFPVFCQEENKKFTNSLPPLL